MLHPPSRTRMVASAAIAAVLVLAGGVSRILLSSGFDGWFGGPIQAAATFLGSETCAACHQPEAELWRSSHHKLAMDHATDKSVLGNFNDASFDYFGVHSRFFRKDGKFRVETDGPDGKLATFEVKYTFGVDPL